MDDFKFDDIESLGISTLDFIKDQQEILDMLDNSLPEVVPIKKNVGAPNLILPRADLVKALRYASVMIRKVTNDPESSSLNITYADDGKVLYRLKDNMTWVTLIGQCEVSNNNPIRKTLSFNVTYLTKLLSTSANDFLIYVGTTKDSKENDKEVYYVRLANGDYIVDVFEGRVERLTPSGNKTDLLISLKPDTLTTLCNVMLPLINSTQDIQNKRTTLYTDRAIFNTLQYRLQYKNTFNPMCFGRKDLELLKLLTATGEDINIYKTDAQGENRILITTPSIEISTSVSIPNRDAIMLLKFSEVETASYIKVDKEEFRKVLFLSSLGMGTVARVQLNYNPNNNGVDAKIIGKDGRDSNLLISGDNYNNLAPLENSITIYAPDMLTLLKSFEGGKDLEIALLHDGIALRDAKLGIEAIMNYAR